jgi:predicted AlkP superfamily pyrophosphatase or phosphodiesterase
MNKKLLLIILDGVPYRNWRRLFGNLEGWVDSGDAQVWTHRAVLPSISASCYASLHTGVSPQVHGCTGNGNVFRLSQPDVFSQVRRKGGVTGAVAHSFWSEFFNRHPFDLVRDIEFDEPENATINHGRFHSMTGRGHTNQMTPLRCRSVWHIDQSLPEVRFGLWDAAHLYAGQHGAPLSTREP